MKYNWKVKFANFCSKYYIIDDGGQTYLYNDFETNKGMDVADDKYYFKSKEDAEAAIKFYNEKPPEFKDQEYRVEMVLKIDTLNKLLKIIKDNGLIIEDMKMRPLI